MEIGTFWSYLVALETLCSFDTLASLILVIKLPLPICLLQQRSSLRILITQWNSGGPGFGTLIFKL